MDTRRCVTVCSGDNCAADAQTACEMRSHWVPTRTLSPPRRSLPPPHRPTCISSRLGNSRCCNLGVQRAAWVPLHMHVNVR
ncbi:hypothetical protein OH77DRAFT_1271346 [Trametes cingulata]|nr:hypothetical protein OH77DRAFT_1271346 [Trametes cingulata]